MRNFNRWIYSLIEPYLGPRVVEIGCGIGSFTELLSAGDRQVLATDIEPDYLERVRRQFEEAPNVSTAVYDLAQPLPETLQRGSADAVVCMNVLEHIEDDLEALRHIVQLLAPGGRSILLVPAFQWLYGSIDESYRHFRRYHRRPLEELSRRAGLVVERTFYVNLAGIVGWYVAGRILKRKILPAGGLQLYHRLVSLFRFVEKVTGPPVGLSLISIGMKPDKSAAPGQMTTTEVEGRSETARLLCERREELLKRKQPRPPEA